MTAVTTVLNLPILVECILNIDRRRTRPPIETLTSLPSVDVAMHAYHLSTQKITNINCDRDDRLKLYLPS